VVLDERNKKRRGVGEDILTRGRSPVVSAFTPEANLKRKIRAHLRKLGFEKAAGGALKPPSNSKESIRSLHEDQRRCGLKSQRDFVISVLPTLLKYFADGYEVDPANVQPVLELIEADTWQSDLFRLASLSWSVPVSVGFGRRLRYLVWDANNNKLVGIMALGDPVFNLKVRDDLIGWSVNDRGKRLVNMLDAYVLGAVPPYNMLLGGKLVACLMRTKEVRDDFRRKYGGTRGVISRERKRAQLVMVTTTSALGKSSVYNRLKLNGQSYLRSIGFTQGWGHFHIPDSLFQELRAYLREKKHGYVDGHRFGQGPNWKLRTIRVAFDALGFREDMLRHGIGREVFVCELAVNATKLLRGECTRAAYRGLKTVAEIGALARERWLIPRSLSRPEYKSWRRCDFRDLVLNYRVRLPGASSGGHLACRRIA
jgi:hypothetical protein